MTRPLARPRLHSAALAVALLAAPAALPAQREIVDRATLQKIQEEGFQRSRAMTTVSWLADVYGPRLTGGPEIREAAEWAKKQLADYGLSNIREERFPFGRGWSLVHFSASMVEPRVMPIVGMPKAWTRGTEGPVTADVVLAPVATRADLERHRGQLRGKIVLTQPEREVRMLEERIVLRMNEEEVREAERAPAPTPRPAAPGPRAQASAEQRLSADEIRDFYVAEGAVALIDRGSDATVVNGGSDLSWETQRTDGGTVFVGGGGSRSDSVGTGLPAVTIAVEHYNRMVRILEKGLPVRMELDVRTRFHEERDGQGGFNILAEIPGTDPKLRDEVVILGAHFDSWHGATGATDNATGVTAMMEAMRILKAIGAKPRRTIRLALWGGEEQGLLGSRAYARAHLGDPRTGERKPGWEKFAGYFNLDNGTGRIRGVWLEGNDAAGPIFRQWMEPLAPLGVTIVGPRTVGSTDHAAFTALGLPGFQFVQERLEYRSRTHHSTMDFVDRVQPDDLMQQAVVAASFAYLTAMRDEPLPRTEVGAR
ncbi:MAG TPA: M20/M25/M40 family metallo-hydrolase [Gemmatimonadaceae bacterium]|nr:M20/M25/M40 family metallo-hydrolase [Gemmatimonadaceae bacterium]